MIVFVLYTNKVCAQTNVGSVTLTVNVYGTFTIEISPTSINLGTVQAGGSVTSVNTVTVTASSTNTVYIKLALSHQVPGIIETEMGPVWPGPYYPDTPYHSTPGTNTYVLCGLFNSTLPNTWDFNPGVEDGQDSITTLLDEPYLYPRFTNGENFAGDQDGYNMAPGESQNLWFKFIAPTYISVSATPFTIFVIITAESMTPEE